MLGALGVEVHGEPLGLALDVILERFGERRRLRRGPHARRLHQARHAAIGALARVACARQHEAQEIARRLA